MAKYRYRVIELRGYEAIPVSEPYETIEEARHCLEQLQRSTGKKLSIQQVADPQQKEARRNR